MIINVNLSKMSNIGKQLKDIRKKLGISQFELCRRSNVSQASIARIETNQQKNLKSETLEKLSRALGISLSQLMAKPETIAEETHQYSAVKMIPVVTLEEFITKKIPFDLKESALSFEPVLTKSMNAFFVRASGSLACPPGIKEGDLILIEPDKKVNDSDLSVYIFEKTTFVGRMFYEKNINVLQPLTESLKPIIFKKRKKTGSTIFRISEIRKKF